MRLATIIMLFSFYLISGVISTVASIENSNCPSSCECYVAPDPEVKLKLSCNLMRSIDQHAFYCPNGTSSIMLNINIKDAHVSNTLLETCAQLRYLFLDNSRGFTPTALFFDRAPNLSMLSLRNCSLHDDNFYGESMRPLRLLHDLNLGSNRLRSVSQKQLKYLSHVRQLNAEHNEIFFVEANAFVNTPEMTSLVLNNNQLRVLRLKSFAGLHKLILLRLDHNQLVMLEPGLFDDLIHLKYLYLQGNKLRTLALDTLNRLVKLSVFNLESNRLIYVEPLALIQMHQLEELILSNNQLNSFDLSLLHHLPLLKQFEIHQNLLPSCLQIPRGLRNTSQIRAMRYSVCEEKTTVILKDSTSRFQNLPLSRQGELIGADQPRSIYIRYRSNWLFILALTLSLAVFLSLLLIFIIWKQTVERMNMLQRMWAA